MRLRIHYETHSTSTDNEADRASGHANPSLSTVGQLQAGEMRTRLEALNHIDAVYTSDLARAVETVEIACAGLEVPRFIDARLRECDFGDWTRRPPAEVHAEALSHLDVPFPGGESYRDVALRVRAVLDDAASRSPGGQIVIVAHRATHHAVEHWCAGRPLDELVAGPWVWQPGWSFEFDPKRAPTGDL